MDFFDDMKQKVKEIGAQGVVFAKAAAEKTAELAKTATEKTSEFAKITKLKAENEIDKSAINKIYAEIGKTYYSINRENPLPEYEASFAEITASLARIDARLADIDELRADAPADFEQAAPEDAPESDAADDPAE
jgi:hypothetical protein